jgi:hypothetical protein
LTSELTDEDQEIESGAICAIACAAAIEAIANRLLSEHLKISYFDELRISSKFEFIAKSNGYKLAWGEHPWQEIAELIRIRNWLIHFKSSSIGLLNSDGVWLKDEYNQIPRIDPGLHLRRAKSKKYYESVLQASKSLVLHCQDNLDEYSFLETENYQSILIG